MSGEGFISNVREVRQRLDAHLRPQFDRRPGALEATRGLALVGVVGTHLPTGWSIGLRLSGGCEIEALSIEQARKHAAEVLALCDFIEHGVPD